MTDKTTIAPVRWIEGYDGVPAEARALRIIGGSGVTCSWAVVSDVAELTLSASGAAAPTTADYLVKTANGSLSAERVVTDTASVVWDWATGGQAKATVPDMVGDSGSGGTAGLVPAPAAGDGAAARVLHADGTWALPQSAGRVYYLDPADASDIASHYTARTSPSPTAESMSSSALTGTSATLIYAFATEPGEPGIILLPPGTALRHFHAATGASNQVATITVEIYTCASDGTSATLRRTDTTAAFSGAAVQEVLGAFTDPSGYTMLSTDRLLVKVYGSRVSGPATCNLDVYWNGTARAPFVTSTIMQPASGGAPSGAAGGDLGGAYPNPTVTDLTIASEARGDLLTRGIASWGRLAPGTSGYALTSAGAGADLVWAALQPLDATLTAWAAAGSQGLPYFSAVDTVATLTLAADKGVYATGAGALATYDLTAGGRAVAGLALGVANTLLASDGTSPSWSPHWLSSSRYVWIGASAGRSTGGGTNSPAVIGAPAGDVSTGGAGGNFLSPGPPKLYAIQANAIIGSVAHYGSASAAAELITAVRWVEIILRPGTSGYTLVSMWAGFQAASVWPTAILDGIVSNCILVRGSTPAGDTTWKIITADGAAQTVTDTGVTIVASTTHIFLLRNDGSGWAWQVLDSARTVLASGTITGTLPAGAMGWGYQTVARVAALRHTGGQMRFSVE